MIERRDGAWIAAAVAGIDHYQRTALVLRSDHNRKGQRLRRIVERYVDAASPRLAGCGKARWAALDKSKQSRKDYGKDCHTSIIGQPQGARPAELPLNDQPL